MLAGLGAEDDITLDTPLGPPTSLKPAIFRGCRLLLEEAIRFRRGPFEREIGAATEDDRLTNLALIAEVDRVAEATLDAETVLDAEPDRVAETDLSH